MAERKEKNVITIDPSLWMDRQLHLNERRAGWSIFRAIYWGIYFIIFGSLLIYYSTLGLTVPLFFGIVIFIFAIMLIIFGFVEAMHNKLMKKYA
ncbi:hypothetical protein M1394_01830 [Candidatus Marsarchaeota archaeon]|jgi:fatty acid desaturase|nr:hypothetical protein [Candidatus Marsarchaeota archaeon]